MENTVLYGAISKLTTDQKNCWPFCTVTDIPKRKWQHYCIQTCWQSIRTCRQSISVFLAFKTVSEILLQRTEGWETVVQCAPCRPVGRCRMRRLVFSTGTWRNRNFQPCQPHNLFCKLIPRANPFARAMIHPIFFRYTKLQNMVRKICRIGWIAKLIVHHGEARILSPFQNVS